MTLRFGLLLCGIVVSVIGNGQDVTPLIARPVAGATADDYARLFAGQSVPRSSPLMNFIPALTAKAHAIEARELSKKWESHRLSKIRKWATTQIHPQIERPTVLKYMFGGPDFVHAATMFPEVPEYILAGLEPLGTIPDFSRMESDQIENYLTHLNFTLRSISERSFFITKEMREDFGKQGVDGVFPVLLYFAALTDHEVLNAKFVTLSAAGKPVLSKKTGATGIWLELRPISPSPGAPKTQNLYYFKTDLSNGGFRKGTAFYNFLNERPGGTGYLKAASYLMHTDGFSNIRNFLVSDCDYILQDASGIPADFFATYYTVTYYGNYIGPIDMFKEYDQLWLRQVYRSGVAKPLPFGTGYRMKDDHSVQMLGRRK